jgi:hypothetical protein
VRLTDTEQRAADFTVAKLWRNIRESARQAFDGGGVYTYHDGRMTHSTRTLPELARVTRRERKTDGVHWPEDPR